MFSYHLLRIGTISSINCGKWRVSKPAERGRNRPLRFFANSSCDIVARHATPPNESLQLTRRPFGSLAYFFRKAYTVCNPATSFRRATELDDRRWWPIYAAICVTDIQQLRNRIAQVDGGELTDTPSVYPYSIAFPAPQSRAVIYTTKYDAVSRLLASDDWEVPVAIIGRYGLPRAEDIPGIAGIVCDYPVYFLGDCDPFDLLVFAWLRQHLSIRYLGTSDAVVSALGVDVSERITIPFPDEEQRAMSLVREVWPEFATSVGSNLARLLDSSRKLELEALVSFHTNPVSNLLRLLSEAA
jgi:hypothetical protein